MVWQYGQQLPEFPKVLSRDTDVKTLFSKDSGYSSMVSKMAHQPNPNDCQEIRDPAKWESESVASVKSLATMNTISPINPTATGGAAEELAEMLVKDESICGLIKDGYKNFESDHFEQNLRRILRKFAFSLRREARNDLEKSVSQLALERFLELLPGAEEINAEDQLEQNESGSDVDSDFSNDEQPYLPTLEKVKLYLVSSRAYSEFKQQLAEFVRPSCTTYHLPSDKSALADMDLRSDKVVDVGEGDLTTEEIEVLAEIDTGDISTDGAPFQAIRKQYLSLRGFRSRFWLLKPAAISFVRLLQYPVLPRKPAPRRNPTETPRAPPKSEVDTKNWVYDPCPPEGDPPIAEDLFLHYLQCTLATFGWGIHIDEGPNFAALFKANFLVLVFSGVAAGLWKFFEHGFQGAFGFACWIVAVLNSLLMAYMFKWKQE
ncbi:hypothetical protein B0J14DRAFT_556902 [Halenospora varia]|nr:hypothetical protein B0J14DRAFT_556902 [Halenospora varia]